MKKYKITDIIEDEFGCEGRPEEEPMVTILLVDDTGKQRSIRMEDKLAYEKKLDIGAEMELPEEEVMTLNGKEYKVKNCLKGERRLFLSCDGWGEGICPETDSP